MQIAAPLSLLLAASLSLGDAAAAQSVHVVDDDAPADFADLGTAVAAAADGDVILLRTGAYSGFGVVIDRPLSVVAESGAAVTVGVDSLVVRDLAAGGAVLLQGLAFQAGAGPAVLVEDCAGVVQIEDVTVVGNPAPHPSIVDRDGIAVTDSARVVLARSSVQGSSGVFGTPGVGLRSVRSGLHLFETRAVGGVGASDASGGLPGAAGLAMEDGFLFAAGSTLEGGAGGDVGTLFGCDGLKSGDGGPGLSLAGAAPLANLLDTELVGGGPGAVTGAGTCTQGSAGEPSEVLAGVLQDLPGAPHAFTLDGPVHASETTTLSFAGTPGELAWILFSVQAGAAYVPGLSGSLTLGLPAFPVAVGALDGSGATSLVVPASLPAGAQGVRFFVQSLFYDPVGAAFTLSTPAALVVLADGL